MHRERVLVFSIIIGPQILNQASPHAAISEKLQGDARVPTEHLGRANGAPETDGHGPWCPRGRLKSTTIIYNNGDR